MCGILLIATGLDVLDAGSGEAHSGPEAACPAPADFEEGLRCRGPDLQGCHTVHCGAAVLRCHGSLLQLRGAAPSRSPLLDGATGGVLLFNGQLFPGSGLEVPPLANDAQLLLQALSQAAGDEVPRLLTGLRGPWALVFWQAAERTLWFGRDAIGRRSLLLHLPRPEDGRFMLSSSAPLNPAVPFRGFVELPPGICSLQLPPPAAAGDGGSRSGRAAARYDRHEWTDPGMRRLAEFKRAPELVEPPLGFPLPSAAAGDGRAAATAGQAGAAAAAGGGPPLGVVCDEGEEQRAFELTVDAVMAALRQAVATRCGSIEERQQQSPVAAAGGSGLRGGLQAHGEARQLLQGLQFGSARTGASGPADSGCPAGAASPAAPLAPPLLLLPPAPLLILFSGGVDSSLLAALAHEALPPGAPIDLASICFDGGTSPDRRAALDALQELRAAAPGRTWRLIQVDCRLADVEAARGRLLRLLAPADTVMDLNIGAALWLAARGEGVLSQPEGGEQQQQHEEERQEEQQQQQQRDAPPKSEAAWGGQQQQGAHQPAPAAQQPEAAAAGCRQRCRSAARVVLLGHGADELCGGYGRHRTAFRARGWVGLEEELRLDLGRLWLRNLGRDDRLVADHGREARHPFLDEGLVGAVLGAPLWHVADLRLPPGRGDKRVLRACLRRLGLPRAAERVKRAIQFGSRLAAQTNARDFGGTRRANQRQAGSLRLADVAAAGAAQQAG